MKRTVPILVTLAFVLAATGLAILVLRARPSISMTLVEYRRWPHGAMVRLTNGSRETIRYLAERSELPMGYPILYSQKTATGWSNQTATLHQSRAVDALGKPTEVFYMRDDTVPRRPGEYIQPIMAHELKPGRSTEFFIRLEPDGSPKRVGTICCLPQSKLAMKLQPWLSLVKQWCRAKTTPPGQMEVWCEEPLAVSLSGQPAKGN